MKPQNWVYGLLVAFLLSIGACKKPPAPAPQGPPPEKVELKGLNKSFKLEKLPDTPPE
ncbi:MAG: hypothetical protein LV481_11415 [Methylacidiphilales bacterium]|nr:hypothetical protein [Candidatus Methylacidiphilales bacterium]